ncbi:MAG: hypothetical protein ACLR2G_13685 [Phascolarctobacterium faecium]
MAGVNGKTNTSAMISVLLHRISIRPLLLAVRLVALVTPVMGQDHVVAEADESDGSLKVLSWVCHCYKY